MADDDEDFEGENEDLTEGLEAKKTSGKKIVIIVAGIVIIALIGWGAMMFLGSDDKPIDGADGVLVEGEPTETASDGALLPAYHKIENLVVNLDTGGRGIVLLRISVSLELEREGDRVAIEAVMPAITNDFIIYLKSLRPDDFEGTKGLTRIQEELMVRINQTIAPKRIRRILFEDFLITPQ